MLFNTVLKLVFLSVCTTEKLENLLQVFVQMKNSLREKIENCLAMKRPILSLYLTAGYPSLDETLPLLELLDKNGADLIELGIPFSDPIADGPTMQNSSYIALQNNVDLKKILTIAQKNSHKLSASVILMGYYNPILKMGHDEFVKMAVDAKIKGVIVPDLLPEDTMELRYLLGEKGISLIYLISPNTSDKRIKLVDELTTSFIYAVSVTGVTGARENIADKASIFLKRLRQQTGHPILVGFGISSGDDAAQLTKQSDGVIVGSALINQIQAYWGRKDGEQKISDFIKELRLGLGGGNHEN